MLIRAPAEEEQNPGMMMPPACFTMAVVLFVPNTSVRILDKRFLLSLLSPEHILPHGLEDSGFWMIFFLMRRNFRENISHT